MRKKEFIENCCIALEIEPGSLNEGSSPHNVKNWDSMGWLNIMAMIDEKFGVSLYTEELDAISNLGDLIKILENQNLLE